MLYKKCQDFITTACCRNKVGDELHGVELEEVTQTKMMMEEEGKLYMKSQKGIQQKSFAIRPEDFDITAGHDINKFLEQNADLQSRKLALIEICNDILSKDKKTKIIVFADGRIGGGHAARAALNGPGGPGCTWLDSGDSVQVQNQKIAFYQHGDATEEDKNRPRTLVLHFEHAAGLNLQSQCSNLVLFSPLYTGVGGASSDVVADVSTELQAIGRVYRPGQQHPKVTVHRIEIQSPDGEECLDGYLIRRNVDVENRRMAVNSAE